MRSAEVRLSRRDTGQIVGAGVLVGDREVVTCAHVVNAALGRDDLRHQACPDDAEGVLLEFVHLDGGPIRKGVVRAWEPPGRVGLSGDVAGLELTEPAPTSAFRAKLSPAPAAVGTTLRAFGYPEEPPRPDGVTVNLVVKDAGDGVTQQVDTLPGESIKAQPGFSGAPAWQDGSDAVFGLVTGTAFADQEARDAYLLPPARIARHWEDVLGYVTRPANPYVGLKPFSVDDAELFFGRRRDAADLAHRVLERRVVAVLGPSGVGKSSLARAGLARALAEARGRPGAEDVEDWTIVTFRPAPEPWMELAKALARVDVQPEQVTPQTVRRTERTLRQEGLSAFARPLAALRRPLVVVADQFEELVTDPDAMDPEFLDVLVPPPGRADDAAKVVLTMRTDVWEAWPTRAGSGRLTRNDLFLVPPMTADQRREAVTEPAAARNVGFEAGLVDKVVDQTSDDSLPLLQFVLSELWETQRKGQLAHEPYDRLGGVTGFLDRFAEDRAARLRLSSGAVLDRALLGLVGSSRDSRGNRLFMRRRLYRAEVGEEEWRVLTALGRERLVVIDVERSGELDPGNTGRPFAELAHERLITAWRRLHEVAEEHADFLDWLSRTQQRAEDHDALSEEQIRVARRWLHDAGERVPEAVRRYVEDEEERFTRSMEQLEKALADATALRLASDAEVVLRSPRGRTRVALALALESLCVRPTVQGQSAVRRALAVHRPLLAELTGLRAVRAVAFSGDGARFATASDDGTVRVLDSRDGVECGTRILDGPATAVAFSADGERLATASERRAWLLDAVDMEREVAVLSHPRRVRAVAVSADGRCLVSAGADGLVRVHVTEDRRTMDIPHGNAVNSVAVAEDGGRIVTGASDGLVRVFDGETLAPLSNVGHRSPVTVVGLSPDGRFALGGDAEGLVMLSDPVTGDVSFRWEGEASVEGASFDPAGKLVAVGRADGGVTVHELSTGALLSTVEHEAGVSALSFGETSRWLVTGGRDGTVRVFDAVTGRAVTRFDFPSPVLALGLGLEDTRLAVGTADGTLSLLGTLPVGAGLACFEHGSAVRGLAFCAGVLATATTNGSARVYANPRTETAGTVVVPVAEILDVAVTAVALTDAGDTLVTAAEDGWVRSHPLDGGPATALGRHAGPALCVSARAGLVISGGKDGQLRVVRRADGELVYEIALGKSIRAVALGAAGRRGLCATSDGRLCVADLGTGSVVLSRPWPEAGALRSLGTGVPAVDLAADYSVVACGVGRDLLLLDAATGQEKARVEHEAQVTCLALLPDGTSVAAGFDDHVVRVVDMTTGRPTAQMDLDGPVSAIAVSPDGSRVLAGGRDGTARLFETDPEELRGRAAAHLSRPLDEPEMRRFGIEPSTVRHAALWESTRAANQIGAQA